MQRKLGWFIPIFCLESGSRNGVRPPDPVTTAESLDIPVYALFERMFAL